MNHEVDVSNEQNMYLGFFDIFPEIEDKCSGFRVFNWTDTCRKILISLAESEMKILFSVRKDEESGAWDQFSALLIPGSGKNYGGKI